MARYIYEQPDWPQFRWDKDKLAADLAHLHLRKGRLMGTLEAMGFSVRNETQLQALSQEIIQSSEIEGEFLNAEQVRSSIARRLNLPLSNSAKPSEQVEGAVEMLLDATQNYSQVLTKERLCLWQSLLFAADLRSAYAPIRLGDWRDDTHGPMQIVSGPIGRERIHFEAPPAKSLNNEMKRFIEWINLEDDMDPILKAGMAHYWFVTLHPFDDGNGRVGRNIIDWLLARYEQTSYRFYSLSAQIRQERKSYYTILEKTSKGSLDITPYLEWFIYTFNHALDNTEESIQKSLVKKRFWERFADAPLNDRQKLMLNKLLEEFEGKLNTAKWAKITKTSEDTALRDIRALVDLGILRKNPEGGRSTSYTLIPLTN